MKLTTCITQLNSYPTLQTVDTADQQSKQTKREENLHFEPTALEELLELNVLFSSDLNL